MQEWGKEHWTEGNLSKMAEVLGTPVLGLLQPSTLYALCEEMNLSVTPGMKDHKRGDGAEAQGLEK